MSAPSELVTAPLPALPTRARPRGDQPLELLFERPAAAGLPARAIGPGALAGRYGTDLSIPIRSDRPTVIANFVETLDGVVAMDPEGRSGGGEISGFSPTDRFVMGVLRALADVVLVGAATVRASDRGRWTPAAVSPADAPAYAALRERLGLPDQPTTLVATRGGGLDPDHPVFADPSAPVVVAAPPDALERLRRLPLGPHVGLAELTSGGQGRELIGIASRLGARVVLSEGGPSLLGELIAGGMLDELFLTVAPQLAGRLPAIGRLSLVEGVSLWPSLPRWLALQSIRRAGDHLFLRYALEDRA